MSNTKEITEEQEKQIKDKFKVEIEFDFDNRDDVTKLVRELREVAEKIEEDIDANYSWINNLARIIEQQ